MMPRGSFVVKLTETAIRSALKRAKGAGERLELADPDLPGLRLRVTPAGHGGQSCSKRPSDMCTVSESPSS